jgi:cysteine desulfurase
MLTCSGAADIPACQRLRIVPVIYLDHNATTPIDPRVAHAMEPFLSSAYGNPSSVHRLGREARRAVEEAREAVARLLGAAEPDEVVFTSGGTEADALALRAARRVGRRGVAVSTVEHPAVREAARALVAEGLALSEIAVDAEGRLDRASFSAALEAKPGLVSVMTANNEYGGIFPVEELARSCHDAGALFHTDAVAALGKLDVASMTREADLVAVSAHKIGGPKGVGALRVRRGLDVPPLFPGGGQERRRRGGTENVPGIVGFGEAARAALEESAAEAARTESLRDRFERELAEKVPGVRFWGAEAARLPNTSSVAFPGASGEALLIRLDLEGIAVSTGSACSSGTLAPSPAILALGATAEEARSTLRFSFGAGNGNPDVDAVVAVLAAAVRGRVPA